MEFKYYHHAEAIFASYDYAQIGIALDRFRKSSHHSPSP